MTTSIEIPISDFNSVAQAAELHRNILSALDSTDPVVIDFSETSQLDVSVLQILMSITSAECPVQFRNVSDELKTRLIDVGVTDLFD